MMREAGTISHAVNSLMPYFICLLKLYSVQVLRTGHFISFWCGTARHDGLKTACSAKTERAAQVIQKVSSYRLNSIQWLEFSSSLQVNFARPHAND